MADAARIKVIDGDTTSFLIAERVSGGWQSGVMHYPDRMVYEVRWVRVVDQGPLGPRSLWVPDVPDEELVALMARAMHECAELFVQGLKTPDWDEVGSPTQDWWCNLARAALRALGEAQT